jgi:outer membrane immunogenic protein
MKRILIAGALALSASGQVLAADLPPAPAPPRAPAAYVPTTTVGYSWGGVYVGINGGGGFGKSEWTNPAVAGGTSGTFDVSGGLVGGTIGVNFQATAIVFGLEADLDWSFLKGSSTAGTFCALPVAAGIVATTCETRNNWLGTARGRIGFAADRALIYATGGAAFGDIETGLSGGGITSPAYDKTTKTGWTAGGGVEVGFADNWSAKLEYLYIDLGTVNCSTALNCGIPAVPPVAATATSVDFTAHTLRVGINYRFGGGAVGARY